MRNVCLGFLLAALLSTPAFAGQDPAAAPTKAKDPDKIVCKTDRSTGSMIAGRICKKRSEWEQEKFQAQELMDDNNRSSRQSDRPRGGG